MAQKPEIPQKRSDRPQAKHLSRHVRNRLVAAGKQAWKDLGRELIPNDDAALGVIEVNAHGDVTECCDRLFKVWLERQPEASWGQLIEGLNEIEQGALAKTIEDMLEPSVASATASQTQKATGSASSDYGSVLEQKPQMWELTDIVIPRVKNHWKRLAYAMRYDSKVESFDEEGRDLHERCEKLFKNWLNTSHGPTPKTYQTLLKYIKKIDDLTTASEEIEKKLIKALSD